MKAFQKLTKKYTSLQTKVIENQCQYDDYSLRARLLTNPQTPSQPTLLLEYLAFLYMGNTGAHSAIAFFRVPLDVVQQDGKVIMMNGRCDVAGDIVYQLESVVDVEEFMRLEEGLSLGEGCSGCNDGEFQVQHRVFENVRLSVVVKGSSVVITTGLQQVGGLPTGWMFGKGRSRWHDLEGVELRGCSFGDVDFSGGKSGTRLVDM
eukprot:TRINITY_DN8123_c0_g1_i1.p1 TRINITY_DN8123_c0_g1~~TRINITY_DN8123_c0_g1_i1.p1  ORF type:complete len:205 (+),score=37.05 TRINITY_DN8123_c0_g1_i1:36-650(+)